MVADVELCLSVLRTKPFPESTVKSMSHQVLHGLAFMHDHGQFMVIIHSVFFSSGQLVVKRSSFTLYLSGQVNRSKVLPSRSVSGQEVIIHSVFVRSGQ